MPRSAVFFWLSIQSILLGRKGGWGFLSQPRHMQVQKPTSGCYPRTVCVSVHSMTTQSDDEKAAAVAAAASTTTPPVAQPKKPTSIRPHALFGSKRKYKEAKVMYGEASRKYRRTVFSHGDWIKHRSSDRMLSNLKGMFFSGIIRQLQKEIAMVAGLGAFIVIWNGMIVPSVQSVALPVLALPALPFTLSSPALGLLLVFRTNASYSRWCEARLTWQKIVAQCENMVRMSATFVDDLEASRPVMNHLAASCWLYVRSLMNQLSGPEDNEPYEKEVRAYFGEDSPMVERILQAPDRALAAWTEVSLAVDDVPIDEKRRVEIDKSVVLLVDYTTACERLYTTPVPLVYTRHTARFLSIWMLFLPFALFDMFVETGPPLGFGVPGWDLIPAVALIAVFLFGIEELAIQLEEPFSILPMQRFCDRVKKSSSEILEWCEESRKLKSTRNNGE